jgi:hypothetical protein
MLIEFSPQMAKIFYTNAFKFVRSLDAAFIV